VDEDAIREGVRRIGEVVREQVAMYGTLTGVQPARPSAAQAPQAAQAAATAATERAPDQDRERQGEEELAKVLHMPVTHKRAG
jgi:2-aminoadipate transaminase